VGGAYHDDVKLDLEVEVKVEVRVEVEIIARAGVEQLKRTILVTVFAIFWTLNITMWWVMRVFEAGVFFDFKLK
jgi:hypothetical protein